MPPITSRNLKTEVREKHHPLFRGNITKSIAGDIYHAIFVSRMGCFSSFYSHIRANSF